MSAHGLVIVVSLICLGSGIFSFGLGVLHGAAQLKACRNAIKDTQSLAEAYKAAWEQVDGVVTVRSQALTSILALETPHANSTVRRMAAVAREALGVEQCETKQDA